MNFNTSIGRLRIIGWLEGMSLLILIFIAVPMKHVYGNDSLTHLAGPVHGALFLLFVLNTWSLSVQQGWSIKTRTWKILLACLIPFGTFYVDRKILRHL
jgi:integral membrane protein